MIKFNFSIPFDSNFMTELANREGIAMPSAKPGRVLKDGETIDLGGGNRTIQVVFTPGHSDDSISLIDQEYKQCFMGDFLWSEIVASDKLLPHSNSTLYAQSAKKVLQKTATNNIDLSGERVNGWKYHVAHNNGPVSILYCDSDLKSVADFFSDLPTQCFPCGTIMPFQYGRINERVVALYE